MVLCYKYLIMHVHIVQSDFHVRQIPFRGDCSPHTALPHLVEPPSACFAKLFLERIPISTVEEAYVHVHKIASELERYANDDQPPLNCDARGMDFVRATPILVPLKLRLRVIFLRMHRPWLHYTKPYQPRGATCIPELSEEQRLHWVFTHAETVFGQSYFGVLTDTLKVSGLSMHPLRGAIVAAAQHNDVFHVPMLEGDAETIVAEAVRLEADTGTRQQLLAHTHKKRKADHMVAAAQERRTNGKVDEKRDKRPQKKRKGLLSGWVVKVHRHHAKAPAPRSRTQKSLRLSSNSLCY